MTYSRRPSLYSKLAGSALLTAALGACSSPPAVQPPPTPGQPVVTKVNFVYLPEAPNVLVNPRASISAEIQLPAGASVGDGVDSRTLTTDSVYVVEDVSGLKASADLNTSGGGDVIVLAPGKGTTFKANTKYTFRVTGNLKDLDGVGFKDFSASFTTGNIPPLNGAAAFTQMPLGDYQNKPGTTVPDKPYTAVKIGPDGRLYASTLTGEILRFDLNQDGTLGKPTIIRTVIDNNGGDRTIIGMAFDPNATASNPILWISNNNPYDFKIGIPDWSGKISRLSGPNLGTYQDYVTGLPRSIKDHMTNSLAFKPGEPNALYITQGSSNSFGDPDTVWGCRPEHLLSGALLRLDLNALGTAPLPINVRTDNLVASTVVNPNNHTCGAPTTDPNYSGPFYNPYAAGAPLTLYATGLRNAYSLIWHSNGHLYAPTNGSASGGNAPAVPSTLPASCANRFDHGYTGGPAPAITNSPNAEADYLFDVAQGGYYGHPNPTRCEYVLNGGNPTSGTDPVEVRDYPVGVRPDPNYRGAAFVFPVHSSADGVIEYLSAPAHPVPALDHKLLVTIFSAGSAGRSIVALTPNPNGGIAESALSSNPIAGLNNFSPAPLNLVENPATGDIYVAQLNDAANGGSDPIIQSGTITLVRPQ